MSERGCLLTTLGLAFLVRGVFFVQYRTTPFGKMPIEDEAFYEAWAQRLLAGGPGANPASFHMSPFPAYTLAAIHRVFGPGLDAVRIVHGLTGVANVALLYVLVRRVFGPRIALVSSALLAVYAPAIFYETSLLPVVLSITFPIVALLALTCRSPRAPWPELAAGVALGGMAFVRGNALLLVPVFAAWVVWRAWRARAVARGLVGAAALLAGALLAVCPATLHNLLEGHEPILLTWHGGQNLYIGNHAGATGLYVPLVPGHQSPDEEREDARALAEAARGRSLSGREVDDYWRAEVRAFARTHPGELLRLAGRKTLYFLNGYEFPDAHDFTYTTRLCRWMAWLPRYGLVVPLAAAGCLLARRARERGKAKGRTHPPGADLAPLFAWGALAYAASVIAFFVFGRYRLPIVVFLAPFAALALNEGLSSLRARRLRPLVLPAAVAVAFGVLALRPMVSEAFGLASASYNVGLIHEIEGAESEARAAYEQAAAYNPRHFKSYLGLARLELESGEPRAVLELVRKAIELAPKDPEGWTLAGDALVRMGRIEEARGAYRAALEASPGYAPARAALGRMTPAPASSPP